MYIASNDIKKIHASSGLKNLRFSKYFDDVTRVWSYLKERLRDRRFTLVFNLTFYSAIRCYNF